MSENDPVMIIVGAGIAGLVAADELINKFNFKNVRILEASDRPGGRIQSVNIGDSTVDLGAQYIHSTQCEIYQIAKKLGVLADHSKSIQETAPENTNKSGDGNTSIPEFYLLDGSKQLFLSPGGIPTEPTLLRVMAHVNSRALRQIMTYPKTDNERPSVGVIFKSVLKDVEDQLAKLDGVEKARNMCSQMYQFHHQTQQLDYSCLDWNNLSINSHQYFEDVDDDEFILFNKGGYGSIIDYCVKQLPPTCILFNSTVENIDYSCSNSTKTIIRLENGQKFEADHVIVTCPMGVLKKKLDTMFIPALSIRKQRAIKWIGYGAVGKVIIEFSEPFWGHLNGYNFISSENQEPTKQDLSDAFHYFIRSINSRNVLIAWVTGKNTELVENASDEQVIDGILKQLKNYLGRTVIPTPSRLIRTFWCTDKNILGAYTYFTTEFDKLDCEQKDLSDPVLVSKKPIILFAGEGTSEQHFSTVHGAFETGQREARRLAKFYSRTNKILTNKSG